MPYNKMLFERFPATQRLDTKKVKGPVNPTISSKPQHMISQANITPPDSSNEAPPKITPPNLRPSGNLKIPLIQPSGVMTPPAEDSPPSDTHEKIPTQNTGIDELSVLSETMLVPELLPRDGSEVPVDVVVKVMQPNAFPRALDPDDTSEESCLAFTRDKAYHEALHEAKMYREYVEHVQGDLVPQYYGMFVSKRLGKSKYDWVYAMVMEECGTKILEETGT
ncbi:uncharacterized protein L201_006064 [Kwoniella dendrophila CBS 6074]|uniref:Protein kinase domain-containing protein n=1 Tax=Kwoniella dendrophila CBS 6074 TaxID=1295534 RepID=A0AAX4K316_9TREE